MYTRWLNSKNVSEEIKQQIISYTREEKEKYFNSLITFGTAGIRGLDLAGTNTINENIIAWVMTGYANYLKQVFKNPQVVIAFDSRLNSKKYALISAQIMSNNNIKVNMFLEPRPTPQLSNMIRHLKAHGGIHITASHNSKEYNGCKLYNNKGAQYVLADSKIIEKHLYAIDDILAIDFNNYDKVTENIKIINNDRTYIDIIKTIHPKQKRKTKIMFTPLNGCSIPIITKLIDELDFHNITYAKEQMHFSNNFTIEPNPENFEAYQYALQNVEDEEYIVATDFDADRVGLYSIKDEKLYSGNEIAILLITYLLKTKPNVNNKMLYYSNVSSELVKTIAHNHGISSKCLLTGFKYIGNEMNDNTLMCFEESNGYLLHTFTRDKDGIDTALTIFEMIDYYALQGKTLLQVLDDVYQEYGFYFDKQITLKYDQNISINSLFESITLYSLPHLKAIEDYRNLVKTTFKGQTILNMDKSTMMKMIFLDDSWIAIRPSGTEPKIKIYYNIKASNKQLAEELYSDLKSKFEKLMERFL